METKPKNIKIIFYNRSSYLDSKTYPKISIITVVKNGQRFLESAIKSVINQTYKNIEYIIIDGGSNGSVLSKIKKYYSQEKDIVFNTEIENKIDTVEKELKET